MATRLPASATGSVNWALWLGGALAAATLFLAAAGPDLAPADPLKENYIVFTETGFVKPPFAPFVVDGFWLGADEFGRDLFSRLLWAVRPTVTLVLVVAAVRLTLGLALGLAAGWSAGRTLDRVIRAALSIPVLLAALFVIAATGQRWGLWAFILGLAITGWADVARLVAEQTRLVKGQRFVEAARALGASEAQIIGRHVLPHLLPFLWIWLALEASSALLATAGLGFLGYFINAIWIPVEDWVGVHAAGNPELGQMLSFSATSRQPWSALAAGSLVVLIVLGFNLLSDGLRRAFSPEQRGRPNRLAQGLAAQADRLSDQFFLALAEWQRMASWAGAASVLLAVIAGGSWWLWSQTSRQVMAAPVVTVPGNHLWGMARHDASATLYVPARGPATGETVWTYTDPAGLYPPVVAADGVLYAVSAQDGGSLLALSPEGALLWRSPIPDAAFPRDRGDFDRPVADYTLSVPALSEAGEIIVADGRGTVHAFAPAGHVRWTRPNPAPARLLTQPIIGLDGGIYLATDNHLIALAANGATRWQVTLPTYSYSLPVLRLSADGRLLTFQDFVVAADSGDTLAKAPTSVDLFIFGADGQLYLRRQAELEAWEIADGDVRVTPRVRLDARGLALSFGFSGDGGVLPGGRAWFLYSSPFGGSSKVVWADAAGQTTEVFDALRRGSPVLAIDQQRTMYLCDAFLGRPLVCAAYAPGGAPVWETTLSERGGVVLGGALTPGRLYVVDNHATLYALGDAAGP